MNAIFYLCSFVLMSTLCVSKSLSGNNIDDVHTQLLNGLENKIDIINDMSSVEFRENKQYVYRYISFKLKNLEDVKHYENFCIKNLNEKTCDMNIKNSNVSIFMTDDLEFLNKSNKTAESNKTVEPNKIVSSPLTSVPPPLTSVFKLPFINDKRESKDLSTENTPTEPRERVKRHYFLKL